ncbi:hypothetical protein L3X38_004161 [Prunus dulcis]|uniref:Uncharacterized protein n=1 Tax=Prunus dulcis TaxID=3755 RepID=A0AAD4ZNF8_PRUDU|nr:hypothetical protein L3X38_004161 [Prunus dulcis]
MRTVGVRIADQVDQMSPESSEDYRCRTLTGFGLDSKVKFGSGPVTFPGELAMNRLKKLILPNKFYNSYLLRGIGALIISLALFLSTAIPL